MLKSSSFNTNSCAETFAPLIVIVAKVMPDIDQALLNFIDVMNVLDPLLHLSHIFVVNWVQLLLGGERSGEMNAGVSFQKVDCLA